MPAKTIVEGACRLSEFAPNPGAPDFISIEDEQFKARLELVGYLDAYRYYEEGAPVYVEMPSGDEVMRIKDGRDWESGGGEYYVLHPEPVAEGARCQHRVSQRTTRMCSRPATVQRAGRGYCSRHDPDKAHSAMPLDGRRKFKWMAERLIEDRDDDDYPFGAEDFYERVATQRHSMVREFAAKLKAGGLKGVGRISWPRLPAEPLSRIWLVYGKRGTIFDEEAVGKIADQVMTLMARLYASTEICGHTPHDLRPECEEDFGRPFTEEEWDAFLGMMEDDKGNYLLSDYAWRWLEPLYDKLYTAKTAEQKLLIVDRILNVVHQRSDLAGVFVQGGQATLSKIANQGGHTTPDEEHEQGRAMLRLPEKDIP